MRSRIFSITVTDVLQNGITITTMCYYIFGELYIYIYIYAKLHLDNLHFLYLFPEGPDIIIDVCKCSRKVSVIFVRFKKNKFQ